MTQGWSGWSSSLGNVWWGQARTSHVTVSCINDGNIHTMWDIREGQYNIGLMMSGDSGGINDMEHFLNTRDNTPELCLISTEDISLFLYLLPFPNVQTLRLFSPLWRESMPLLFYPMRNTHSCIQIISWAWKPAPETLQDCARREGNGVTGQSEGRLCSPWWASGEYILYIHLSVTTAYYWVTSPRIFLFHLWPSFPFSLLLSILKPTSNPVDGALTVHPILSAIRNV